MAQNRAADELARLVQAQQQPVKAARQVDSLQDTRTDALGDIRELQERSGLTDGAGFAFPEALVTAVGAGWILGPAGGLALGIAQGILGKKAKQNALDAFAREQEVIGGVDEVLNGEFDRLAAQAVNAEDQSQLSALQTQKDAAMRFLSSASPRLQEQGAAMLAEVQTGLNGYAERQEADRVAAEAYDAELKRELDQEQYNRFTSMKVRFDDESAPYENILQATNTAMDALAQGTPAQLWAASVLVNKALDPTSVVRQEEANAIGQIGSLWTKGAAILEKAFNGKSILPKERRQLQGLLTTIQKQATEIQLAREARYMTELEDAEVPTKYWDNFSMVDSVPAVAPGGIPDDDQNVIDQARDAAAPPARGAVEAAGEAGQSLLDRARSGMADFFESTLGPQDRVQFEREQRRRRGELPTNGG